MRSSAQRDRCLEAFRRGELLRVIREREGVDESLVSEWARLAGLPGRKRGRPKGHTDLVLAMISKVATLREGGMLFQDIGDKFHISKQRAQQLFNARP